MSLSSDQIVRANSAIAAARASVADAERAAGPGGYVFPTKEQRTAAAMRSTLDQIESIYAGLLDDSTPPASNAQVDEVIANARQLASPTFAATMNASVDTVGDAAAQALPSLSQLGDFAKLALWAVIIGGAVYLVSNVKGAAKALTLR